MKFWGRARAPPRPTPWRRFRLCARSIEDHHVAAIVLRPVRSVSAPAARADGGVGGGKGPSARSLRGRTRLGVYGCLWEYIMEALSLGVRARATQSAAHSTARWVRATSVRVEAGCASRPTIDGTHLARKPDGDRPHGRHRRLRFRHFLQQSPADTAPAPGRCSAHDVCATARTAGAKSPHLSRLENARRGAVGSANPIASASTASGSVPLKRELDFELRGIGAASFNREGVTEKRRGDE